MRILLQIFNQLANLLSRLYLGGLHSVQTQIALSNSPKFNRAINDSTHSTCSYSSELVLRVPLQSASPIAGGQVALSHCKPLLHFRSPRPMLSATSCRQWSLIAERKI